jgi:hypothetical protein
MLGDVFDQFSFVHKKPLDVKTVQHGELADRHSHQHHASDFHCSKWCTAFTFFHLVSGAMKGG